MVNMIYSEGHRLFVIGEFIIAAWNPEFQPELDDFNKFDASPDGLSGNIEGFYFANWLMPFTLPFYLNNIVITPDHYPTCLNGDPCTSTICDFFNSSNCPILQDSTHFDLTREGFFLYKRLIYTPRLDSDPISLDLFDAAQRELLDYGCPLHYRFLSRIINNTYPNIIASGRKLYNIMKNNPVFFRMKDNVVFHAIRQRKRVDNRTFYRIWAV